MKRLLEVDEKSFVLRWSNNWKFGQALELVADLVRGCKIKRILLARKTRQDDSRQSGREVVRKIPFLTGNLERSLLSVYLNLGSSPATSLLPSRYLTDLHPSTIDAIDNNGLTVDCPSRRSRLHYLLAVPQWHPSPGHNCCGELIPR